VAKPIPDECIHDTPKGVKVDLKAAYVYPDGKAYLLFPDEEETQWPMADQYEVGTIVLGELFRPLLKRARRNRDSR
jgi:hypothetical protein